MKKDFSHRAYEALILALQSNGYRFSQFDQADELSPPIKSVILRHDIDRLPNRAIQLARLEHSLGVRSTYFFRVRRGKTNEYALQTITDLGHQIGYHYETLADANGNHLIAYDSFVANLEYLRKHCDIKLMAMHGRPLSQWDNQSLWDHYDYKNLGLMDAYLDLDWTIWQYVTDTGRAWNKGVNLRDYPRDSPQALLSGIKSTELLGERLVKVPHPTVISTHPERWANTGLGWIQVYLTDFTISSVKRILQHLRRNHVASSE